MKLLDTGKKTGFFHPLLASQSVQAAMMTLKPGQSSSDTADNDHPRAEQWVFVIEGVGQARVGSQLVKLRAGHLLLIQQRERHLITNTGAGPLRFINFYSPPAYTRAGNVNRSVKP